MPRLPRLRRLRSSVVPRRRGNREERPQTGRFRRRRAVAAAAVVALVAVAGVGLALLVGGGSSERKLSPRDRAQLELAAPGSSRRKGHSLAVPAPVRLTASRLPLSRQVAQLFVIGFDGQYPRDPIFTRLRARDWGGVVIGPGNFVDDIQLGALGGEVDVVAHDAGHLEPLIGAAQVGGPASAIPDLPPQAQPLVGDSGRATVAAAQARAAAGALKGVHINMTMAPVADVGTAAGPMQDRVYSDDPGIASRLTRAAVDAYRSAGVITAVGHFPGQGAASDDPDNANATVGFTVAELRHRDLLPFAAVIHRTPVIQLSNAVYAAYDGVTPAVELPQVVGGLLRQRMRFNGVVMTGDLAATAPVLGETVGSAAVQAVQAGSDLLYVSGGPREQEQAYRAVLNAATSGRIARDRLELSVLRVLALKRRYGLLPQVPPRPAKPARPAAKPARPAAKPAKPAAKPPAKPAAQAKAKPHRR